MATHCSSVIEYDCDEDVDEEMQKEALDRRPCYLEGRDITPEDLQPWVDVNNELILAVGDLLEISLFGDEELDVEQAIIAGDGNLYFFLLPPIPAAGRTLKQPCRYTYGGIWPVSIKIRLSPSHPSSTPTKILKF